MWIIRGWLHPRLLEDIPIDVMNWLKPVAAVLQASEQQQGR